MQKIIRDIVKKRGAEVIASVVLVSCMDDEGAFTTVESRVHKKILRAIISDGYARKLLDVGAWNNESQTLAVEYARKNALNEDVVTYVFKCLAFGLGWTRSTPTAPKNEAPSTDNVCLHCGTALPIGAKFCTSCGTPVGAQNSTIVIADEFVSEKFETEYYWYKTIKGKTGDPEVIIGGIYDYVGPENIIIPSHVHYKKSYCVTHIADFAFSTNNIITSVTISDSITRIGSSAFFGCSNLKSVTIPNSVTSIGENAFYGCKSLETINIPKSVTSIGESAFYGCPSVTINVPNERMAEFVKKNVPSLVNVTTSKKKSSIESIPQPKQKGKEENSEQWQKMWKSLVAPFESSQQYKDSKCFAKGRLSFLRENDTFRFLIKTKCVNIYRHPEKDLPGCLVYVGDYSGDGIPNGEGTCYGVDGKPIYFGKIKNGKPLEKYPDKCLKDWSFGISESTTGNIYVGEHHKDNWKGFAFFCKKEASGISEVHWRYYDRKEATIRNFLTTKSKGKCETTTTELEWSALISYSVVMTDYPLFRIFTSIKFDEAWMKLAGITKEKRKELWQKYEKDKSLILASNLSLEDAKRWKTTLEDIGGKIKIQKIINN